MGQFDDAESSMSMMLSQMAEVTMRFLPKSLLRLADSDPEESVKPAPRRKKRARGTKRRRASSARGTRQARRDPTIHTVAFGRGGQELEKTMARRRRAILLTGHSL